MADQTINYLTVTCIPHGKVQCEDCFPAYTVSWVCLECSRLQARVAELEQKAAENEQVFLRTNAANGDLRMQVDRLEKKLWKESKHTIALYETVIPHEIRVAVTEEREACAKAVCRECDSGTLHIICAAAAIRARGEQGNG